MNKYASHDIGGGNVFADIGLADAQDHLVKAELVYRIDGLMTTRGLRQVADCKMSMPPNCSASASPTCRKCCAATSARSRSRASCVSSSRSDRHVDIVVTPHKGKRKPATLRVTDGAVV